MTEYAALWTKSNSSFLEGASHPEELVEQAHRLGLRAIALTDRDGVYGIVKAHVRAQELGVKVIYGSEVTLDTGGSIVLLAESRAGYGNLCQLLSRGRLRSPKGESRVSLQEVCDAASGLQALWRGDGDLGCLREAFGRGAVHATLTRHLLAGDGEREAELRGVAKRLDVATVAATEVLYHSPMRRPLQDVLTCVRHGVTLHSAGTCTRPNGEHALLAPSAMAHRFADDPLSVERTLAIADRCSFSLADLRYRYPSERLPDGSTSMEWLRELVLRGARQRYAEEADVPADVLRQLERELSVIADLDYPGYFLTMWEIVQFCRREGILCQGRGSAANSAVCYCLGITAVDPVRMGLLFERFLSRERAEPPDIDLDIGHERREEVIQHVYSKYGRRHAAMVANVIRYRVRSAVREVGKVLGMSATTLDRLAKLASRWGGEWRPMLEAAGLDPRQHVHQMLMERVDEVLDFPRHLSIHPGGFLLGDRPVDSIVPIENATMADRTVIQWDKDDIESLGLFKVDLLGLGALTLVDESFRLLREHRGVDMALADVPADDEPTYDMICAGDTIGVFQIESRAQMAMLPRLRPRKFYDLVIEVSIVRPGPIAGDMVHPYLRRKHGEEEVTYPHPSLEPVLERTLGVPLFQEQVMKLAVVAADYTPGEADQLRRDMAAWRSRGRIERHRVQLIERMQKKGIALEFAERVFEQIRGFGEYGFPESHAASFALIAYATAWLRCHHPAVFTCALLNAQPMGFYTPATILEDAKRHGVVVRGVDVATSAVDCTLEAVHEAGDFAVRIGLRYVHGLGSRETEQIMTARAERPFVDLADFARRTRLPENHLAALARAGALATIDGEGSRREALWDVYRVAREVDDVLPLPTAAPRPRFEPLDAFDTVAWDYDATGHSPLGHPLAGVRDQLSAQKLLAAEDLRGQPDKKIVAVAGLVICRQQPSTANGVTFLTLEDETGLANLVVWQKTFDRYQVLIKSEPFLAVRGKLQNQQGVVHLIAQRIWVPKVDTKPKHAASRDFH